MAFALFFLPNNAANNITQSPTALLYILLPLINVIVWLASATLAWILVVFPVTQPEETPIVVRRNDKSTSLGATNIPLWPVTEAFIVNMFNGWVSAAVYCTYP